MADGPTREIWAQLRTQKPVGEDQLTTRPVTTGGVESLLSLGIDIAGNLHLLIPVQGGPTKAMPPDLKGLKVRHQQLESGEFLDLTASPSYERSFSAVCTDVINAVLEQQREPWAAVAAIIREWQSAWRPERTALDRGMQIGLFGELYVLKKVMIPCLGSAAVYQWSGPESERHDFVSDRLHIEVKTTCKSRQEHEISRLDQLRVPGGCQLLFVSVQLEQSISGNETLATIVDEVIDLLRDDVAALDLFMTRLAGVGWSDEMRHSADLLRFYLRDASVYLVDEDFPRLPDTFTPPSGVVAIRYTVDLANLPVLDRKEVIAMIMEAGHCSTV